MKIRFVFFLGCFLSGILFSQNASEIQLSIEKLKTIGSVLYIAAHPDDENTRLLAYLVNEKKLRTGYLSITRGDGGQNLIGKEQGDALGVIRTQELLAARKVDGAEQFFTRANDFGYSKTPEETLKIWNRDSVLSDMVWVIRNFKPDVIICRFPTTGEGGHGHHTASAILAIEAFHAAADSVKFPAQLKYTSTWKSKRIVWNTFNFGTTNTTSPDQVKIDVGVFNPLTGKNYGEIASESRTMHKSQGFGTAPQRGSNLEYFKFLAGDSMHRDVFENIDLSWKRMQGGLTIDKLIQQCLRSFNHRAPQKSIPGLVKVYKQIKSLNALNETFAYWKEQKLKETEKIILACAGVWLEAMASDPSGVPGATTEISARIIKRNPCDIKLTALNFPRSDSSVVLDLETNKLYTFKRKENVAVGYSEPYWLKLPHDASMFQVSDLLDVGKPEKERGFKVSFNLKVLGLEFNFSVPIEYKFTDPVKGEIIRNFDVLPALTVNISNKLFLFADESPKTCFVTVKANTAPIKGYLVLNAEGWKIDLVQSQFELKEKNEEIKLKALITPLKESKDAFLIASVKTDSTEYTKGIQRIEYDHIPHQFILSDARSKLVKLDVRKKLSSIAYIPGAGDEVPQYLSQTGIHVKVLDDEALATEDLSAYPAILTGVRAYNTNERLQQHYHRLMEYVQQGGNLVVQYNTNNRIGPVLAKIGPYPFTITRDRVTNENSEVKFIKNDHVVFNQPNSITKNDFAAWVQERGIYFVGDKDDKYETVLAMNDPLEKELDGSIIIGKYGKGNFVYSGLAFFRQIPAGVPGAYKLLINLLSLPQNQ
jgi:LmbE family N-acetylglucosaminyl deacetylase